MKTVILAAGIGNRLRPLTNNKPKAFISVGTSSIISQSLKNLKKAGLTDVIIVVGFMDSYFKKELGDNYEGMNLTYILNKDFSKSGSMYSLSQTEGYIDDDILLLESDLLYERNALAEIINHPYPEVILVSNVRGSGDEVNIHTDDNGFLINLGKSVPSKNALGELVGISKMSIKFLKKLYKMAKKDYEKGEYYYHYEEVIFRLSNKNPVKCLFMDDLLWTEIDTNDDLKRARNIIYPKIKEKESIEDD